MQLADAPEKIIEAFATEGDKNEIPVTTLTPGAASWSVGFPPLTMVDPTEGGIGPSGLDFNGIYNALSALSRWFNAGAGFVYDATFAAAVGGYPAGARVLRADHTGYWLNVVDQNTSNPDTGGAGWALEGGRPTASVYASTQQPLAAGSTKVQFDTVEFDSGLFDISNRRFVVPFIGKYRLSGAIYLNAPGGQLLATEIRQNGALAKLCFKYPQVSDGDLSLPFDAIINCEIGDYLEVFVEVAQSTVTAGLPGSNQPYVFAQLEYLGA